MEVFSYQESRRLYLSICRGDAIQWPVNCRNCNLEYPSDLKTIICRALAQNPAMDLLELTSGCLRRVRPACSYCCINNFKPTILANKPDVLVIEENLRDWNDLSWDDDDNEDPTPEGGISLISLLDSE